MTQEIIGNYLKKLREARKLTQEELAEKFCVSQRSVSRWENGDTLPDILMMKQLATFYGVDIDEIVDGGKREKNMNNNFTGINCKNPTTPEEMYELVESLIAGKERYSSEHLDDKKAIMVYRDEKQLMCFGPHKKGPYHFRLVSKKTFDAELGNDVEYSYHDSWFFKHCYESNDFGRLMELAAKGVNV